MKSPREKIIEAIREWDSCVPIVKAQSIDVLADEVISIVVGEIGNKVDEINQEKIKSNFKAGSNPSKKRVLNSKIKALEFTIRSLTQDTTNTKENKS